LYTISDWLERIFAQACKEFQNDGTSKFKPVYVGYENDLHFYGFADIFNSSRGIGFVMNHE
jgi:hypothetical protein